MTHSVTFRNLLGGFLGGVAGILATASWSPYALVPAVFLGVLLGWYHQELLVAARGNMQQQPLTTRMKSVLAATTHSSSALEIAMREHFGTSLPLFRFVLWLVVAPLWLLGRVPAAVRWARVSSERQARLLRALTSLILPLPIALWVYQHVCTNELAKAEVSNLSASFFASLLALLVLLVLAMPILLSAGGDVRNRHSSRVDTIYQHRGVLAAMGMMVFYGLRAWALCIIYAVVVAVYIVLVGVLTIVTICIPVMTLYAIVRMLVCIAQQSGHRLCLSVTLAVTVWSAWRFHGQFESPAAVWVIALVTGIASGMVTEAVRRSASWLLAHTTIGAWVTVHPYSSTVAGALKGLDRMASHGATALVRVAKRSLVAF